MQTSENSRPQHSSPLEMNIDKLPLPVLYELLSFFNVGERRALEKMFDHWDPVLKSINEHTTSLCVYSDYSSYPFQKRWSFINQLIGYHNAIPMDSFHLLLERNSNLVRLKNVRRLCLTGGQYLPSNFSLSKFASLQHLELEGISNGGYLRKELPNLRILVVRNCSTYKMSPINTPSLEVLIYYPAAPALHRVSFVAPVELRYLECESYPLRCENVRLARLETLVCKRVENHLQNIALNELPALKQLQVCECANDTLVRNLKLQQFELNRRDLNLVFLNLFNLTLTDPLSCYPINCYFIRAEHMRSRLGELSKSNLNVPHRLYVYYTGFSEQFDGAQMRALLKRFTNVYQVEVFDKVEPTDLVEFLRHCGQFKVLELYYTSLGEVFFDQLQQFSSLAHLKIKEHSGWRISSYEFLKSLPDLRTIFVYYDGLTVEIDHIIAFLEAAFKHCKNLKQFAFGREYFNCLINKWPHMSVFYLTFRPQGKIDLPPSYPLNQFGQLIADLTAKGEELSKKMRIPIRIIKPQQ